MFLGLVYSAFKISIVLGIVFEKSTILWRKNPLNEGGGHKKVTSFKNLRKKVT